MSVQIPAILSTELLALLRGFPIDQLQRKGTDMQPPISIKPLTDRELRALPDHLIKRIIGITDEMSHVIYILADIVQDLADHAHIPQNNEVIDDAISWLPKLAVNDVLSVIEKRALTRAYDAFNKPETL